MNARERKYAARTLSGKGTLMERAQSFQWQCKLDGQRHYLTISKTALVTRGDGQVVAVARSIEDVCADALKRYAELTDPATRTLRKARLAAGLTRTMRMDELLGHFGETLKARRPGTQRSYADSLKPIRAYFVERAGNPDIETIRARDIEAYLDWRRDHRYDGNAKRRKPREGAQPAVPTMLHGRTLAKDRAVLHRIFALADRREWRNGNPVKRTDKPEYVSREAVILNAAQYDALITACADYPMLRMYVVMLGETGVRCNSEALRLRWEDIDLDAGLIHIVSGRDGHHTKSGKGRMVPMTDRLSAALRQHFAAYRFGGSPWVFYHDKTHGTRKQGERINNFLHGFTSAAQRAKVPDELHQHELRHRRVTTWLAEGQNPVDVQYWMGHSHINTTMGYYHHVPKHLRTVAPAKAVQLA